MAAGIRDKLAAADQAAQAGASGGGESGASSETASRAAVVGIDKPLTADGLQHTSNELPAALHAAAGPAPMSEAVSDPALAGISKPIQTASSQAASAQAARLGPAPAEASANAEAAGGPHAASTAAPGLGGVKQQQQMLSQRVCGSPAIDGCNSLPSRCMAVQSPGNSMWKQKLSLGGSAWQSDTRLTPSGMHT
jgi:hypothetical protein